MEYEPNTPGQYRLDCADHPYGFGTPDPLDGFDPSNVPLEIIPTRDRVERRPRVPATPPMPPRPEQPDPEPSDRWVVIIPPSTPIGERIM